MSKTTFKDNDSIRLNIKDDVRFTSSSRSFSISTHARSSEKEIHNNDKLIISQNSTGNFLSNARKFRSSSHHSLKRRAEEKYNSSKSSSDVHSVEKMTFKTCHVKMQSEESFVDKNSHFDREVLVSSDSTFQHNAVRFIKRLFNSNINNSSALLVERNKDQKHISSTRHMSDFSALVFRSKKIESEGKDDSLSKLKYDEKDYIQKQLRYNDKAHENVRLNASHAFLNESAFADQIHETYLKPESTMISQLKTRSIFVDQLFAEVRDIQIDLNMIKIKCIEIDECQSVAVQKKNSSRKNKLSNKQ